jgi:DNA-binding MarR family transcriptional regulator
MAVQRRRAGTVAKEVYETHAAFRFALRQFLRFSETTARKVGLTPQQYQALLAIRGFPERDRVKVGELAQRLQIHHHSAVGLVDRLMAKGLALRERSTVDRRQVFIHLTTRGVRILQRVSAANRGELRRLRPQLIRLLGRIARLEGRRSPSSVVP